MMWAYAVEYYLYDVGICRGVLPIWCGYILWSTTYMMWVYAVEHYLYDVSYMLWSTTYMMYSR